MEDPQLLLIDKNYRELPLSKDRLKLLSSILSNKIFTMRLYYKLKAIEIWRDESRMVHILPAVSIIQRFFKRIIAKRKAKEEMATIEIKQRINKVIVNAFNYVELFKNTFIKREIMMKFVGLANENVVLDSMTMVKLDIK